MYQKDELMAAEGPAAHQVCDRRISCGVLRLVASGSRFEGPAGSALKSCLHCCLNRQPILQHQRAQRIRCVLHAHAWTPTLHLMWRHSDMLC